MNTQQWLSYHCKTKDGKLSVLESILSWLLWYNKAHIKKSICLIIQQCSAPLEIEIISYKKVRPYLKKLGIKEIYPDHVLAFDTMEQRIKAVKDAIKKLK